MNVDRAGLLNAHKTLTGSKHSARAILYRLRHGLEDEDTPMCVDGIEMIDSKASGVLYTVSLSNPASGIMMIGAALGLGEHLVSG